MCEQNSSFNLVHNTNMDGALQPGTYIVRVKLGSEYYESTFIILNGIDFNNVSHRQHWIAVNGVENGKVTTFDPAGHAKGSTLSDNYSHWKVTGYSVMYATDVMQGQTGTSSNNNCSGDSLQGIYSLLAYVEGTATCNYRGQGEGTGGHRHHQLYR